jgi:siroheme synthase-like protein
MGYLPLFLNVEDAPCLVVGGGRTAHRKAVLLLEAGARVVAVSPRFTGAFVALARDFQEALALREEPYTPGDLSAYRLVFAATDDSALNKTVAEDAQRANLWVNVVDDPPLCSAICGAVLRRGPLQVAVSTGGACPTLSVALRDELSVLYPDWTGTYASVLGELRGWLRERCPEMETRKHVLRDLSSKELRDHCRDLKPEALLLKLQIEAERLLGEFSGSGRHGQASRP